VYLLPRIAISLSRVGSSLSKVIIGATDITEQYLAHYMSERCPVVYCLTVARWGVQQWVRHGLTEFFGCCCCLYCAWWQLTPAMRGPRSSPQQVTFSPDYSSFIHTIGTLTFSSWSGKLFFDCISATVSCPEGLKWERISRARIRDL